MIICKPGCDESADVLSRVTCRSSVRGQGLKLQQRPVRIHVEKIHTCAQFEFALQGVGFQSIGLKKKLVKRTKFIDSGSLERSLLFKITPVSTGHTPDRGCLVPMWGILGDFTNQYIHRSIKQQ